MISYLKKLKNNKLNRGMTYVELIVVLSIFAVMVSIILFNYGLFQAKVDIKNLASDIASQIVQAQKSSLNGLLPPPGYTPILNWKPSYGVYFAGASKNFVYFVDLNNNNICDDPVCGGGSGNESLQKISITKGSSISVILVSYVDTSIQGLGDVALTFTRPNSSLHITSAGTSLSQPASNISNVKITVSSPNYTANATIQADPSGRIQIN